MSDEENIEENEIDENVGGQSESSPFDCKNRSSVDTRGPFAEKLTKS